MRVNKNTFIVVTLVLIITLFSSCARSAKTSISSKDTDVPKVANTSEDNTKENPAGNDLVITLNNTKYDVNRPFKESSLKNLGLKELGILRNSIYAKYGYQFKSKEFIDYFSQVGWYKPQFDDVSNFFNEMDEQNINTIKHYEDLLKVTQSVIKYSQDNKDCSTDGRVNIKLKNNKEETLYITKEDIKTSENSNCPVRIKLKINSSEVEFESLWNDGVFVSVADFDETDSDMDIYITTAGTDIGSTTYIYKYDGKKIYEYDSFEHLYGRFCYDGKSKIYYYWEDEKREFNHFYDYKTKRTGKITDASLMKKLNERSFN